MTVQLHAERIASKIASAAPPVLSTPVGTDFLLHLREVNAERLAAWEGENQKADALFHAVELGGEVGEVLNVVKKLDRANKGWRGSTATLDDLGQELGDALICIDKLAAHFNIDLATVTAAKFNATSDKVGLPHKLALFPTTLKEVG